MDEIITRRIIKPGDCVIGFCIPTTLESFRQAQENPIHRDFVVNRCPDARDYRREVISYTDQLLPAMTALGATVIPDLTLRDFKALFSTNTRVIILFAHWSDDSVEFADGVASIDDVLDAVPPAFDGIIDLCVCHPKKLALELSRLRKDCVVKFTDQKATPSFWLYFYVVVFKKLLTSRTTYLDAVGSAITDFRHSFQQKSCRDYKRFWRRFFKKQVN
jgi:hypothetical protein